MPRPNRSTARSTARRNQPGLRLPVAGSWARLVFALLAAYAPALAQPAACDPTELGFTGGTTQDSVIRGDTALVANGGTGLLVLDVADPTAPREVARLDLPGTASSIDEFATPDGGRIAYIGTWNDQSDAGAGLYVVDVTDRAAPELLAVVDAGRRVWHVRVVGSLLHACQGPDGLATFDLRDPRAPALLSRTDTGGDTRELAADGAAVLVADALAGLVSLDATDPSNPRVLATAPQPQRAFSVATAGGYAYVSALGPSSPGDDAGIFTFDVRDPARPMPLDEFYVRHPRHLTLSGGRLYFSNHIFGLEVYDLADPARPSLLGGVDLANAVRTEVIGTLAYVSDPWVGLVAVDAADPAAPRVLGSYEQARRGVGAVTLGDVVYNGSQAIDASDPASPAVLRWLGFEINDLAMDGERAVAAGDYGMHVLDLSDPAFPREIGFGAPSFNGYAAGVALDGNIAYLCGPDDDFEVFCFLRSFDISDPRRPVLLDEVEIVADGTDVEVYEGYLYFAAGSLIVLDATDPADLRFVSQERGIWITDVAVRDGLLFASGPTGLRVYDLTAPEAPSLIGEAAGSGGVGNLALDEAFAFVAAGNDGVDVFDIRDPASPRFVRMIPIGDTVRAVSVGNGTLSVAARSDGMRFFDVGGCRACRADLDEDGVLTIFDFLTFQNLFDLMDPRADFDGDGEFTIFDFLAFQDAFYAGCE